MITMAKWHLCLSCVFSVFTHGHVSVALVLMLVIHIIAACLPDHASPASSDSTPALPAACAMSWQWSQNHGWEWRAWPAWCGGVTLDQGISWWCMSMSDGIGTQWPPRGLEAMPDMGKGMGVDPGIAASSNGLDARPNKGMGSMGMGVGSGQDHQGVSTGTSVDSGPEAGSAGKLSKGKRWGCKEGERSGEYRKRRRQATIAAITTKGQRPESGYHIPWGQDPMHKSPKELKTPQTALSSNGKN